MSRLLACVALAALPLALAGPAAPAQEAKPLPVRPAAAPKAIDLVLCLDTSNSMDGLIDSAKIKLWDIEADAKNEGRPQPLTSGETLGMRYAR